MHGGYTHGLRYQESKEVKIMKAQLNSLKKLIDRGGATADQVSRKENIEQEIKDKRTKEYKLHQTLEREAYNMGKAHDRCTAEMFRPVLDELTAIVSRPFCSTMAKRERVKALTICRHFRYAAA